MHLLTRAASPAPAGKWLDSTPKFRTSEHPVRIPVKGKDLMPPTEELQEHLSKRYARSARVPSKFKGVERFSMASPESLSPRSRDEHCREVAEALTGKRAGEYKGPTNAWLAILGLLTLGVGVAIGGLLTQHHKSDMDSSDASTDSVEGNSSTTAHFDSLYMQKLENIAESIQSLHNLSQVVTKADETYEEVYHNQLVQHDKDASHPDERDWNGFVKEARLSGPVFRDGKEKLRDAVAHMHRLIRRAPEYLKNIVHFVSIDDYQESSWYLDKVVKLVESVHVSMEEAADRFATVDANMDGMTRDAKENEGHFEGKASRLEKEAKALEGGSFVQLGSWTRWKDQALYGCVLEKRSASLEECQISCIDHASRSCSHVTYYKTAHLGSNCYLHCDTSTKGGYLEADTYALEKAPNELAVDVAKKWGAVSDALSLHVRWSAVRRPLKDVSQLVRRFRAAAADLRKSLEDVRFAADDLKATFSSPPTELQVKVLERRVGDVVDAIEDLGKSMETARFFAD